MTRKSNRRSYISAVLIFLSGIGAFGGILVFGYNHLDSAKHVYLILGALLVLLGTIFLSVFLVLRTLNASLYEILDKSEENDQKTVVKE